MSQQDKEVEAEAARQSHCIFLCSIIGIPDPCGNKIGYQWGVQYKSSRHLFFSLAGTIFFEASLN
jgi:hypothetical protein